MTTDAATSLWICQEHLSWTLNAQELAEVGQTPRGLDQQSRKQGLTTGTVASDYVVLYSRDATEFLSYSENTLHR